MACKCSIESLVSSYQMIQIAGFHREESIQMSLSILFKGHEAPLGADIKHQITQDSWKF